MAQIKQSLQNIEIIKMTKKKFGHEFGVIIKNDPENYPKTGQWRDQIPIVNKEKCIGCATCKKHCPESSISMKKSSNKDKAVIDYQFCKGCGICAQVCPMAAITMKKE